MRDALLTITLMDEHDSSMQSRLSQGTPARHPVTRLTN
jgi:hypothetical protein